MCNAYKFFYCGCIYLDYRWLPFGLRITKDNQGEPAGTIGNHGEQYGKSLRNIFASVLEIIACEQIFIQQNIFTFTGNDNHKAETIF